MAKSPAARLGYQIALPVLSFFCFLIALPFILCFFLYNSLWKTALKVFWPSAKLVDIHDEIWFHVLKEVGTVNCLMEFDGHLDIETARELVSNRILNAPESINFKFIHHIENRFGRNFWVHNTKFDVKDYVQEFRRDDSPKDENQNLDSSKSKISEMELPTIVSELCSKRRYFLDGPLWRIDLIHLDSGRTVWILQMHHIIADGVSFMEMLRNHFFDKAKIMDDVETLSQPNVSRHNSFTNAYKSLPTGPRTLVKLFSLGKKTDLFSSKNHDGRIAAWSRGLDFQMMRTLKLWTDSSINDIFMSGVAGAFLRYSKEENYGDAMDTLPKELRVYLPFNMRTHLPDRLQNNVSIVYIMLPLLIGDAKKRINEIKERLSDVKNSIQPMLTCVLMTYVMPRFPLKWALQLYRWCTRGDAILVSNLAGPPTPVSCGGVQVDKIMFWPPSAEFTGIRVSMITYNSQAFFGAMCDNAIVHNPKKFINCIEKVLRASETEIVPL